MLLPPRAQSALQAREERGEREARRLDPLVLGFSARWAEREGKFAPRVLRRSWSPKPFILFCIPDAQVLSRLALFLGSKVFV